MVAPTKKLAKPSKSAAVPSPLSLEIDELGRLELRLAPFVPDLARVDVLRKAIRARFASAPAELAQRGDGERYFALLGIESAACNVSFTRAGSRTLKVFPKAAGV
jgi:hypothetical protein